MTKYISVAQLKGGAGKSTLATILISFLLSKKKKVLAVDSDLPQGTLSAWASMVDEKNFSYTQCHTVEELAETLESAQDQYDFVVTDTPPRIAEMMRLVLITSDLVLVPMAATAPDVWAFSDMVQAIHDLYEDQSPDLSHIRIVWNEYKPTKKTEKIRQDTIDTFGFKDFKQYISTYVAYSDVIGSGKHIMIHNHAKAKEQASSLGNEILKALK